MRRKIKANPKQSGFELSEDGQARISGVIRRVARTVASKENTVGVNGRFMVGKDVVSGGGGNLKLRDRIKSPLTVNAVSREPVPMGEEDLLQIPAFLRRQAN